MKFYLNSLFVGIVSFVWASTAWLGHTDTFLGKNTMSLELSRPFVYRQLVPLIVRGLSSLGMLSDWAIVLVVTASGVGLYLALQSLWLSVSHYGEQNEIYPVLIVFVGLLLFAYERWYYDLATTFLFTLAFLYILRSDRLAYLIVFTLACLNRETAFLLIIFYVVISFLRMSSLRDWWMTACQVYIYVLVTYCLRVAFQYNDGVTLVTEPWQNLVRFAHNPLLTLVHLSVTGVILWLMFRDWKYKSVYLKLAFWVITPVLVVMYLVCGQAYEVRVFWEIFPVVGLLCIPKGKL